MTNCKLNNHQRAAWITWEIQPRNRSMAHSLGVPLYELIINKSRLQKYPLLLWRTWRIFRTNKFHTVFVQNPSIVLSLFAIIYAAFSKTNIVVDAHNAGIYPLEGKSRLLNFFARFIATRASAVILSNSYLAQVVRDWGGNPLVMPDPLPLLHGTGKMPAPSKPFIYFICTWADDEPYHEVIHAAELITGAIDIYITGNYKKRLTEQDVADLPFNIKLLGFVSETEYLGYFSQSLAAMDLTTREHCLVCGAYEALAVEKPCILSDSLINREIFPQGFIYTQNDRTSIANAITQMVADCSTLQAQIIQQKAVHSRNTEDSIAYLNKRIFNDQ